MVVITIVVVQACLFHVFFIKFYKTIILGHSTPSPAPQLDLVPLHASTQSHVASYLPSNSLPKVSESEIQVRKRI